MAAHSANEKKYSRSFLVANPDNCARSVIAGSFAIGGSMVDTNQEFSPWGRGGSGGYGGVCGEGQVQL